MCQNPGILLLTEPYNHANKLITRRVVLRKSATMMAMVASAMLLAAGTAEYFPFHMDIDHYGSSNASVLHPSVPRVAMDTVFECPHPCGLMAFYSSNGTAVNGGIPQEINMTLHLTTLAATFNRTVPLNESRLLDYDFESWNPVWNRNPNTSAVQNASRARVRAVHPSWTEDEVEAAAKNDFEDAASGTVSPAQGPTYIFFFFVGGRNFCVLRTHCATLQPFLRVQYYTNGQLSRVDRNAGLHQTDTTINQGVDVRLSHSILLPRVRCWYAHLVQYLRCEILVPIYLRHFMLT